MPATSPPTSSGSATNEPLCASFQISERVPSLRRSRSRSALPSPAAATWRIALPGAVGEADRGEPEAALLDRDAAGLVEQRLAVGGAHDERVDGAQHLERAVEALDAPLLQLERAGLLQQLVDHHAQVLLVEVGRRLRRRLVARGERRVHLAQDLVVVRGLDQHARHAVRLRQRLRVLAAEVRGVEHQRRARRWPGRPSGAARARSRPSSASARRRSPAPGALPARVPAPRGRRRRARPRARRARAARPAPRDSRGCRPRREWWPCGMDNLRARSCGCLPAQCELFRSGKRKSLVALPRHALRGARARGLQE